MKLKKIKTVNQPNQLKQTKGENKTLKTKLIIN